MIKLPEKIILTVVEVVCPVGRIFTEANVQGRGGPVVRNTEIYGTFS